MLPKTQSPTVRMELKMEMRLIATRDSELNAIKNAQYGHCFPTYFSHLTFTRFY